MTQPAWPTVEGWLSSGSALSATGSYTVDADPDPPQVTVTLLRFGDDQRAARPTTTAARIDGADCWPSDNALAVTCSLELGAGASLVGEASTLTGHDDTASGRATTVARLLVALRGALSQG